MTDSRVQEIIELESQANSHDGSASRRNWRAARLIFEELETGKTKTLLAEEIGKHRTHVLFMSRCWDLVGRYFSTDALPNFYGVYNSDQVRGRSEGGPEDSAGGDRDRGRGGGGRHSKREDEEDPPDPRENGHNWIVAADEALDLLLKHRIAWAFLDEEDLARLRGVAKKAEKLLNDIRLPGSG